MPPKTKTFEFPAIPGVVFDTDSVYGIAVGDELETATCEGWKLVAAAPALERFLVCRTREAHEANALAETELKDAQSEIDRLIREEFVRDESLREKTFELAGAVEYREALEGQVSELQDQLLEALSRNAKMGDEMGKVINAIGAERWRAIAKDD